MNMQDSRLSRLVAANHLRELLCSALVGDLLHNLSDPDSLDLAQKLAARVGQLARVETDAAEAKK
jgi:hypothetical protein